MTTSHDVFELGRTAADLLGMGPDSHLRLDALRRDLEDRVKLDDPRIPLWLAAAVCRSPAERQSFLTYLGSHSGIVPEKLEPRPSPDEREAADKTDEATAKSESPAFWTLERLTALVVLLFVAGLIALALYLGWAPNAKLTDSGMGNNPAIVGSETAAAQGSEGAPAKAGRTVVKAAATPDPAWDNMLLATLALATPALTAAVYALFELRRRRQVRRDNAPKPQRSLALWFAQSAHGWMTSAAWRDAFLQLRRHRRVVGNQLDVRTSVRATVRAGGMPHMRFLNRRQSPDYLLLSERLSRRDHLAWYAGLLEKRMREEQVAVDHFEFAGDPRRLRRVPAGETEALESVLALHARANPMVLAESFATLAPDAHADWVSKLCEAPTPTLINPRERASWNAAEERLGKNGIASFGADQAGLADYAAALSDPDAPPAPAKNGSLFDLPESLGQWRSVLRANAEPPKPVVRGLIDDLEEWLGQEGLDLLRSLSLFPYLEPELTVYMATAAADGEGMSLTETQLLRLARLPWLRSGLMPDWLRYALVRGLTSGRLDKATNAIQAYLMPQADGAVRIDVTAGSDGQHRDRLREWLRLNPTSVFAERILIDALSGRQSEELGVEVSKTLLQQLACLWRDRLVRAGLCAGLATALLAVIFAVAPIEWEGSTTTLPLDTGQQARPNNSSQPAGTTSAATAPNGQSEGPVPPTVGKTSAPITALPAASPSKLPPASRSSTLPTNDNVPVEELSTAVLSNVISDAQLIATRAAGAQIAFVNPFGVRSTLKPAEDGTVTFRQLFSIQPFNNKLVTGLLTGAEIKSALEQGLADSGPEQFLIPSEGFSYHINRDAPAGARVSALLLNGKPIDPIATYGVTVTDFLANGGDGFTVFGKMRDIVRGVQDIDALEMWFKGGKPRTAPKEERVTGINAQD